MIQAGNDSTAKVVRLPLTEAERSSRYRARKALKKLAKPSRGGKKRVTKAVTESVTPAVTAPVTTVTKVPSRDAVDLVQLKRDIQAWTKLHQEVENGPAVARRRRIRERVAQLSFLTWQSRSMRSLRSQPV